MSGGAPSLASIAGRRDDEPALADHRATRTWGEVERRANALGHLLLARGLVPGDHVTMVVTNRTEFLELLIGLQRAGFVVSTLKTGSSADEIAHVLADAESRLLVGDVPAALEVAMAVGVDALVLPDDVDGLLDGVPTDPHPLERRGWKMSYTSGTTGRPKGVVPGRAGRVGFTEVFSAMRDHAARLHIDGGAPHLAVAHLFHGAPTTFALSALASGSEVRILRRWEPVAALEALADGVGSTVVVPSMLRQLLALGEEELGRHDVTGLRTVVHGGEPCPVDLKERAIAWLGPKLVEYFGFTEGGMTVATTEEWSARPGTVGRATKGRIVVVDDTGAELPPGVEGRVHFAIEGVPFHYRNDPAKTAAAFTGDAFTAGDVGWVDEDGYLFVSGRSADVIVSSGVNVYPAEIEQVIGAVDGVRDVAVVGGPDERRGETPVAFLVVDPGVADVLGAVESALADKLASYKRPRSFHVVDAVPRDPTGKLLREPLRRPLWGDATAFAASGPPTRRARRGMV